MYRIPVCRTCNRHLRNSKIFIHHIKRCTTSATSCHSYCSTWLTGEIASTAVEYSVKEGLYSSAWMCIVNRGTKYKSVCFFCLSYKFIYCIIIENTAFLCTLTASDTVTYRLATHLENFIVNAFFF